MNSVGIRSSYKLYKAEIKDPVSIEVYLDVTILFAKFLADILLKGFSVKLFERLGTLYFLGKKAKPRIDENDKIKGLSPNWAATNKLWKENPKAKEKKEIVYNFNEHSNGIRYRLQWSKKHVFIKYKDFYSFVLSRDNKHKFKDEIIKGTEYYIEPLKFKKNEHK